VGFDGDLAILDGDPVAEVRISRKVAYTIRAARDLSEALSAVGTSEAAGPGEMAGRVDAFSWCDPVSTSLKSV